MDGPTIRYSDRNSTKMHTWSICIEGSAICGSAGVCRVGRPIPFKRDTHVTGTVRGSYVTICGSAGA